MKVFGRNKCSHPFTRGVYGDEINQAHGKRLQCMDCGRYINGELSSATHDEYGKIPTEFIFHKAGGKLSPEQAAEAKKIFMENLTIQKYSDAKEKDMTSNNTGYNVNLKQTLTVTAYGADADGLEAYARTAARTFIGRRKGRINFMRSEDARPYITTSQGGGDVTISSYEQEWNIEVEFEGPAKA